MESIDNSLDKLGNFGAAGALGGVLGFGKKKRLQKRIDELIQNRPKYEIADEYGENQAMAFANLMGRDQAVIQQEENIDQGVTDALGQAQEVSSSSGAILNTLAGLYSNKNKAYRDLAVDEAAINRSKRGELYGANTAMAEEKDKAWNYNVNEPYQLKLEQLVGKQKHRREMVGKGIDAVASIATAGTKALMGGGS